MKVNKLFNYLKIKRLFIYSFKNQPNIVFNRYLSKIHTMQRLFYFLITLGSFSVLGQTSFTTDSLSIIHDWNNNEFITSNLQNKSLSIKHYSSDGNVIWQDSISFENEVDSSLYIASMTRFKNTNKIMVSLFYDITPQTSFWWQRTSNDTLGYIFVLLNTDNHTLITKFDTILSVAELGMGRPINCTPFNDTMNYVFINKYANLSMPNTATYSINTALNLTQIAPSDSISPYINTFTQFYEVDNKIIKTTMTSANLILQQYSSDISLQSTKYIMFDSYDIICNKDILSKDSMFLMIAFHNQLKQKWQFNWLDLSLSTFYKQKTFYSPMIDNSEINYHTQWDWVQLDRKNRQIMVLSKVNNVDYKIHIYDFEFNFLCAIPYSFDAASTIGLKQLNRQVYIVESTSSQSKYSLVNCDVLQTDEINLDNNFTIYPNPTSSNLFIDNKLKNQLQIELISLDGRSLKKTTSQDIKIAFDLTDLEKGIYLIHIQSKDGQYVEQIIKQ